MDGAILADADLRYAALTGADVTGTGVTVFVAWDGRAIITPTHLHWSGMRVGLEDLRQHHEQHTVASISPRLADWWASWAPVVLAAIDAKKMKKSAFRV
jgi:uncharacterized protein YjbI with pentapeptide repeats